MRIGRLVTLALTLALLAPLAAAQLSVRSAIDADEVYVGQSVGFRIVVEGTQEALAPTLEGGGWFRAQYLGAQPASSAFVQIINGRRTETRTERIVFEYAVTPLREGLLTIPSAQIRAGAETLTTEPVTVRVRPPAEREDFFLTLEVEDEDGVVFVGEPVRVRLVWHLASNAGSPSFTLPFDGEAFESWEIPLGEISRAEFDANYYGVQLNGGGEPARIGSAVVDGRQFRTLTAQRMLIPRRTGEFVIGPATVAFGEVLQERRSLFDRARTRTVVVASGAETLRVEPLPTEGRPSSFTGLVGEYSVEARATPTAVNVGDPITIEVIVRGPHPLEIIPEINLAELAGFGEDFRVSEQRDPARQLADGSGLVFRQTARARSDSVKEIPPIELGYFDPAQGVYRIASSRPIALEVRPTRQVGLADAMGGARAPVGEEIESVEGGLGSNYAGPSALVDRGFSLGAQMTSARTAVLLGAPVGAWALASVVVAVRRRGSAGETARRKRRAFVEARSRLRGVEDADGVSRVVRDAFADRLGRARGSMAAGECAEAAAERGSEELSGRVREVLSACDAARFGGGGADVGSLRERAATLLAELERSMKGGA